MAEALYTHETLKAAKFRGPTRFSDGRKGMAQQDFEWPENPRFGYSWRREDRSDKGRTFMTVDGAEVATFDDAIKLLALPPDPESPAERMRSWIGRTPEEKQLRHVESGAESNASAGPFGLVNAAMGRASYPWHHGINAYGDIQRKAGAGFDTYSWLYRAKDAAHESYRLMYLWKADRKADTGLKCILGKACRSCPILKTIEEHMIAARQQKPGLSLPPYDVLDDDIDMAKTWTCITHAIAEAGKLPWEGILHTKDDREDTRFG